jgi:DNA-binding beta-propeller fold protein YncE
MARHAIALVLLFACTGAANDSLSFERDAVLDVGLNPHQIVFSEDGNRAYVAAAGSDRDTEEDVTTLSVPHHIPVPDAPQGVGLLPDGAIAATRFGADEIVMIPAGASEPDARVTTGGAPSLLAGPLPSGELLVSVEESDLVWYLDPATF